MTLDLSYNQIASIPNKAFDETSYAVTFQLSYNMLSNMSQVGAKWYNIDKFNYSFNLSTNVQCDKKYKEI